MGVWPRARAPITDQWSQDLGEFWDMAIRGPSALRAALQRAILDESSFQLGFTSASLLLDLEFFMTASACCY
eukprot:2945338-Pyramimonas_sp.AAC.1